MKKVKLKSLDELERLGLLQGKLMDSIVIRNRHDSWKGIHKDKLDHEFVVTDIQSTLTPQEYETFKEAFEEVD